MNAGTSHLWMWCCGLKEQGIKIILMYEGFKFKLGLLCIEYRWEGAKRIGGSKKPRKCDDVNVR